jgi:4-amino-4-deoxy-L-arabinose transferase-like glycosyltransferase
MSFSRSNHNRGKETTGIYFWLFVSIHTLLWTVGPYLSRHSIPHDTLESISWGLEWQLGYHKHPFLTAWLCAGVSTLFGTGWSVYLLAQIAVSTTFFAAWQLAKKLLPAQQALIATLILEGVLFYNINSFNLTPDTLQSPLWALLALFFYQAVSTQKMGYWLLTGLTAALCIVTKYQALLLLLPLLLLCCFNPYSRISFKKPGLYAALALFLLLITPHLLWLYQHDFITLTYAEHASADYTADKTTLNHLSYPLRFLANAFIEVAGTVLLLCPFYGRIREPINLNTFQWQFLLTLCLGPLLLSLLLGLITGDYFPPRWLTPYFFPFGILAVVLVKPYCTPTRLHYFSILLILFSLLLFAARICSYTLLPRAQSDAFLPNQEIAQHLEKLWHDQYHQPLAYVAGSNYLVASIVPYMHDKPEPYFSWAKDESPWINEALMKKKGALFIWDQGSNYVWDNDSKNLTSLPTPIQQRYPSLKIIPNLVFYRLSDQKPISIGVAILPPS